MIHDTLGHNGPILKEIMRITVEQLTYVEF